MNSEEPCNEGYMTATKLLAWLPSPFVGIQMVPHRFPGFSFLRCKPHLVISAASASFKGTGTQVSQFPSDLTSWLNCLLFCCT